MQNYPASLQKFINKLAAEMTVEAFFSAAFDSTYF